MVVLVIRAEEEDATRKENLRLRPYKRQQKRSEKMRFYHAAPKETMMKIYVYDMFVARFTWLARVISFEAFSMMVDEALERMKKMLESNKAMQTLVSGEAGETVEKDM